MNALLRYGVVHCGAELQAWQSACLDNLAHSGVAQMVCAVESEEREKLRCLDLDFCLLFGDREAGLDLWNAAKYGVWYFAYSDVARSSSGVPGFWEFYYHHDIIGAMLLKLAGPDSAGIVLKAAYLPARSDAVKGNTEAVFSSLSQFPVSVCRDIQAGTAQYLVDSPIPLPPERYGTPSRTQVLAVKIRELKNKLIHNVGREFFREDWSIARLAGTPPDYIGRDARAQIDRVWSHAGGTYLADPHIVLHEGHTYVFCEEFTYEEDRGRLVVGELPWREERPKVVLEEPYHLSYPQVFRHDGAMFCIPESGQARKVCLYRAIAFPERWERVCALVDDFSAIDSTVVQFNGKWWLFCTSSEMAERGFNSHLYIWYADDLYGRWRQHAANPVKIDVRSSRPAGPLFTHENVLYRPSQDCSRGYGSAICLNRIDKLTETEFKETIAGVIRPPAGRYDQGIHTISQAGNECIVDVKRYAFYPRGGIALIKRFAKMIALNAGVPAHTLERLKKRYR